MNILLCLLFLAVSSIGQLSGQRTQGAPPPTSDTDQERNKIIDQLSILSKQLTNTYSMKHSALLGGPCLLCYIPVSSPLGHSSNKLLKRYCSSRLCN